MEHNDALRKCLHSLPPGETAICPIHQTHDHHERDAYRNAVLDEIKQRMHDEVGGARSAAAVMSRFLRIIEDMRR